MRRSLYILIPIAVFAGLIAWRVGQKRAAATALSQMRARRTSMAAPVSVAPAQLRDIAQTFEATTSLEAPLDVKLAPKVTGRIVYLEVREGDPVRKGQVLVRIDSSQVEADVNQARANLAQAQYRLAQAETTENPTNVGIATQIDQQKAGLSSAEADLNQTQQNFSARVVAAQASVIDAQGKVDAATAAIAGAQANLNNAEAKYNRIFDLYKQGFVAAQDVDDAKAAVEVGREQLKAAQAQLNSAGAQKQAAEQQAAITETSGKADIQASKARLEQARAALAYAQSNTAQSSAYRQSLSALRSSASAAEAALRSAEARRGDTALASPLHGFVTARYLDPGAVASPGQPILEVQFMRSVWAAVAVPEEVSTKLSVGQPARVTLDAYPNETFAGAIVQVDPSADPQSRQFTVRVILDNRSNRLRPGMFGRISLVTDEVKNAVAVPREAIENDRQGTYVMVVNAAGKASRRRVQVGLQSTDYVALNQGVEVGEKVIVLSAMPLRDGQPVQIAGPGGIKGKGAPAGPGGGHPPQRGGE
jgi:RND family efflux transporter MFP subunit